jgi:methionyl-tRNA formyltransferase
LYQIIPILAYNQLMTKTIFFGSSSYSLIILESLLKLSDFSVLAVITKPDMPTGRKQTITQNPVAKFAHDHSLPLLQPESFDENCKLKIENLKPDLGLCVAYGPPYFTQTMIDIPTYKIVNIHPSTLPRYRGATPGPWQIINGETNSAVTFFQIDALPDHGPIITQIPFDISVTDTTDSFYQKAFSLAAKNLSSVLSAYVENPTLLTPQDHSQKSYFPKFTKESAKINWSWSPVKIERFVRALNPWPIAWTYVQNQQDQKLKMKIFSTNLNCEVVNFSTRSERADKVKPEGSEDCKNLLQAKKITPDIVQIEGKNKTLWSEISKYYQIIK